LNPRDRFVARLLDFQSSAFSQAQPSLRVITINEVEKHYEVYCTTKSPVCHQENVNLLDLFPALILYTL
jgi:hypothetical protein